MATVSSGGVVTAVSAGTANITFTGSVTRVRPITVNALPAAGSISPSGTPSVCVGSTLGFTNTTAGPGSIMWTESSATVNSTIDASTGVLTGVSGSAGGVSVTVTSTVTDINGCANTATQNVTVYSLPVVTLSGAAAICQSGGSTTLTRTPAGGLFGVVAPAGLATVGLTSGTVTAGGALSGPITVDYQYTDPSTGCVNIASHNMNIDESPTDPGVLSGTLNTWPSATTTLSSTMAGGNWSSGSTGVATIGIGSGLVTGVTPGTSVITYTRNTTCGTNSTTATVTVNPYPTMPANSTISDPYAGTSRTIKGFNTAMIRCTPPSSGGTAGHDYLYAFAHWDGATPTGTGELIVVDNGGSASAKVSLLGLPISTPDVAIFNDASSVDQYLVAVAFASSIAEVTVEIYLYDVTATIPVLSYQSTQVFSGHQPRNVHIDAIAEYNNTGITGWPYCNYAAVTWDDWTNWPPQIYVAQTNVQTLGSVITGTAWALDNAMDPDVAGIEYGGSRTAIVVSRSTPYHKLYLSSVDLGSGTTGPVGGTLDTTTANLYPPRIDANDNDNNNNLTLGNALYKVAAEVDIAGYHKIRTYDNLLSAAGAATGHWVSSDVVSMPMGGGYALPPYNHYSASVAMVGPNSGGSDPDGTGFMVTHMTDDGTGNDAVFAEITNYANPAILTGGAYYWVSDNPAINTTDNLSASAQTCNRVDDAAIVAWYDDVNDDIKCKISGCCYGFKQGPEIKSIPLGKGWHLYPNPTVGELTMTNTDSKGGSYTITDVLGRALLQGCISGNSTKADVSRLAPGTYMVKISSVNGENTVKKFVKE